MVEDTTFIPVIDDVSRKMLDAQRAFLKKDNKTAAEETGRVPQFFPGNRQALLPKA